MRITSYLIVSLGAAATAAMLIDNTVYALPWTQLEKPESENVAITPASLSATFNWSPSLHYRVERSAEKLNGGPAMIFQWPSGPLSMG